MPFADAGQQVLRAASDGERVTGLATLPTPDLPAAGWTDVNELARTVLGEVAERATAEARAQGYAVGWTHGRHDAKAAATAAAEHAERARRDAEQRREDEHRAAVAALRSAAEQVGATLAGLCQRIEEQGTELAWAVTETLVGRELASLTDADVVRRVLAVAPGTPVATVRLHPSVAGSPAVRELTEAGLAVVGDDALDRADALVESDGAVTDLRISTALARLHEVLG